MTNNKKNSLVPFSGVNDFLKNRAEEKKQKEATNPITGKNVYLLFLYGFVPTTLASLFVISITSNKLNWAWLLGPGAFTGSLVAAVVKVNENESPADFENLKLYREQQDLKNEVVKLKQEIILNKEDNTSQSERIIELLAVLSSADVTMSHTRQDVNTLRKAVLELKSLINTLTENERESKKEPITPDVSIKQPSSTDSYLSNQTNPSSTIHSSSFIPESLKTSADSYQEPYTARPEIWDDVPYNSTPE